MLHPSKLIRQSKFLISLLLIARSFSYHTMMSTLEGGGKVIMPKSGTYTKVLVWLHGLGDTADGWASLMPQLKLEDTKFILPTANQIPISLNGGYRMTGWSDIYGLSSDSKEDKAGFDVSAARVHKLVEAEVSKGIPPSKIVVGGFSQGGALSLHYCLRSKYNLAGCIALSTWVPLRGDYPAALTDEAKSLPILQVHGEEDEVVAYQWGQNSHQLLSSMINNPKPEFMSIPRMGHSSDPVEIERVSQFLLSIL